MRYCWFALGFSLLLILGHAGPTTGGGAKAKGGDPDASGYDTIVKEFIRGPFGAVVFVGQDQTHPEKLRVGAAAQIGVSPDAYGQYRFAVYVEARNEAGEIVAKNAAVMSSPLDKGDAHRTGTYVEPTKPAPAGTYTVTGILTAIAKDGTVIVLEQGKTTTVVRK